MGKLWIILCDTPFYSERVNVALKIAETAVDKGHGVSVFLFMDGVYNMMTTQNGKAFRVEPVYKRLQFLMEKGVQVICCKLCMELRGLVDSIIPEGVVASGVSELNNGVSEADAVLSFIGC